MRRKRGRWRECLLLGRERIGTSHHKTGAMLTTAEEVYKDILEYNVEVMEKGDNTTEEREDQGSRGT